MKLMGILNITPDSFNDGGKYLNIDQAIQHAIRLEKEGADIIDIGGESSRPGALPVSLEEELERVIPLIKTLKTLLTIPISIDTIKPEVAEKALAAGASIINDISGGQHPLMQEIAASTGASICIMHMQGTPQNMQINPSYQGDLIGVLMKWFEDRISLLLKKGIKKNQIILDPGIGFGKTVDDNVKILHNLSIFKTLGFPILVGVSRKSYMQKILKKEASQVLTATLAANTMVIQSGIDIIRVHDVAEHRDLINYMGYVLSKQ